MNGYIKHTFLFLSVIFLLLSFWQSLREKEMKNNFDGGGQLAILLDVSQSMNVQDMNGDSRLQAAKDMIYTLLSTSQGQRFSITIFAGESQRILPFTNDISLVATFVAGLDNQNITKQGTRIDLGIEDALAGFGKNETGTLIILTDGADEVIHISKEIKQYISDHTIEVFILGVGSLEGGYIPNINAFEPYKIYNGQRVVSRLNESSLKKLAQTLGGKYVKSEREISLQQIQGDSHIDTSHNFKSTPWNVIFAFMFWCFFLLFSFSKMYCK